MKANEAPEKLWWSKGAVWRSNPNSKRYIEYTRTDAFIEKAVRRLEHYIDNGAWIASDVGHREKEAIIEDFRKYLEK